MARFSGLSFQYSNFYIQRALGDSEGNVSVVSQILYLQCIRKSHPEHLKKSDPWVAVITPTTSILEALLFNLCNR